MKIIIIVQLDFNVCTHRLMEVDDQNFKKKRETNYCPNHTFFYHPFFPIAIDFQFVLIGGDYE